MQDVRLRTGKCKRSFWNHHDLSGLLQNTLNIAKDYFYNKKHQTVEIDQIERFYRTGTDCRAVRGDRGYCRDRKHTSNENGLSVLEEVCPLSARMVVNQVSMKMENERITKANRQI